MPANAAQARLVTQIVILRELADTLTAQAYPPDRCQQKPAPVFGTVPADQVNLPALDAIRHNHPTPHPAPAPRPAGKQASTVTPPPEPRPDPVA